MASFNFKPRFIPRIESGVKGGTIRAVRKYPQKVGKPMQLFVGLRQVKPAYRIQVPELGSSPFCIAVHSIIITKRMDVLISSIARVPKATAMRQPRIFGFVPFQTDEKERLAIFDGFDSFEDMMRFWDGQLPFLGHWYCWLIPLVPRNMRATA